MSITKYRTGRTTFGAKAEIQAVEVERETQTSVWLKGRRCDKHTNYYDYWDSWAQAHMHLLEASEAHIAVARRKLQAARDQYGNVKGMKPPADGGAK